MPTYNSGRTIYQSLESVRAQTISQELVEIIVADGGSSDHTLSVAESFDCKIVKNERVQPEYGKLVGLNMARGRFVVFLDSDEVLVDRASLEKKVALLRGESNVRNVITAGLTNPPGYPPINDYVNRFGEPFSHFMYQTSRRLMLIRTASTVGSITDNAYGINKYFRNLKYSGSRASRFVYPSVPVSR